MTDAAQAESERPASRDASTGPATTEPATTEPATTEPATTGQVVVSPVPTWVAPLFGGLAAVTVVWSGYLAATLPSHVQTRHYRAAWVGFDIGLASLLVLTAFLALRGNRHVGMTATATSTVLVVDAWFDVLTTPSSGFLGAIASAVLVELPLALLCLWIALHVDEVIARRLRQLTRRAERAAAVAAGSGRAGLGWAGSARAGSGRAGSGRAAEGARLAADLGQAGVEVEKAGAQIADTGVRLAKERADEAKANPPD